MLEGASKDAQNPSFNLLLLLLLLPAERKHVEVFSLLAVILQFQMEATKCFGPERWAVGWVFRNGFRNKRAIVVRKELIANIRERFAHLITDVVQGDTRWNTPLILCLGIPDWKGVLRGPKGREYTTVTSIK